MIQAQRHDKILEYLAEHELLGVSDAITLFNASPATIRRDFNELANSNLVKRVRGGIKISRPQDILPFATREVRRSREKLAIARAARKLFTENAVIFVDGGTTTYHLANFLPDFPLRIITNSLRLAATLDKHNHGRDRLDILCTGGLLYPNSGLLLGPGTTTSLAQYHADIAFLSVGGITEKGISNTNELVVEVEKQMIANADKVVILADHSKIGHHAMCHVCHWDKIDILITDDCPEAKKVLDTFRDERVEVITVDIEE